MALNILRRRGLTPLAPGGGGGGAGGAASGQRPGNMPALTTAPLTNAAWFFEDFVTANVAIVSYGSGLVASPDTLANVSSIGSPAWTATEIVGTTGTINSGTTSINTGTMGLVQVASGNVAGNTMALEYAGGSAAPSCLSWDSTHSCLGMCRFAISSTTSRIVGVGLIGGVAVGADWVTAPDTTFLNKTAMIIHNNSSAYSGDAAGDTVFRLYDFAGVADTSVLITSTATTTHHKYEIYINGPAALAYLYADDVLVSGFPITIPASGSGLRWSVQAQTGTAAARRVDVDCFYWEQQFTTQR